MRKKHVKLTASDQEILHVLSLLFIKVILQVIRQHLRNVKLKIPPLVTHMAELRIDSYIFKQLHALIRLFEELNHCVDGLHIFVDVPSFVLLQLGFELVVIATAATTKCVVEAPPEGP